MADEKRKIALCFSSLVDRRLLSEHLSTSGYEVIECAGPADTETDLFIMDIPFAQRSGREVLGLKKPGSVFLPVIIALGQKDDAAIWLSAGFDLCLRMPFSKAELDAAVQTLLRLRSQSEQLLQRVENIYQAIFEATGTATLIVEQDGGIVMANKECLPVTGYTPEELIGRKWMEFATPESLEAMLTYHALRRKDPSLAPKKYEAKLLNKKKEPRYAVLDVNMIPGTTRSVVSMMDVTEQRLAEEALRESETRNRIIAELISDYAYIFRVSPEGELRGEWVTESFTRVFGLTLEEIDARGGWKSLVHPDDRDTALQHARKVAAGQADICEMRWLTASGEVRWLRDYAQPVFDAAEKRVVRIYGASQDITERKKAEEALKESEAKYRAVCSQFQALLDAIPDNISLISPELTVVWVNKRAAAWWNKRPDELIGQHCYRSRHNRPTPCDPCPVQRSFRTEEPADETVTTPDGRIWELRTVPIKEAGRVVNVIEIGRDITEHRKLEERYRQAQKMEVVGQLAGGVAHDFNNILTAIIGYGNIALMQMAPDDPVRLNIENMLEAADRAARLTKEILLFSRKQISERKPADLNQIVNRVEKFLRRVIGEDITFTVRLDEVALPVLADSHQIDQVLMNLATNARDAMPSGGTFSVTTSRIELTEAFTKAHGYGRPGMYALLTVSDTGHGMDEETQRHIFEPFFTTKEVGKGTGLGLAVVYGIIKQHDGFINVYSEPGKGTTFKIYLPLTTPASAEEAALKKEEPPGKGTETILVAEDDEALRKLAVTVLTGYGYTVIEAADGEEAVRKFRENRDRIRLLLFDLIMPRMNGKEAYDEIRKLKPDVKVIFSSGYAPDIVHQKVLLEDHAALVFKPVSPGALLRKVRAVLDGKDITAA